MLKNYLLKRKVSKKSCKHLAQDATAPRPLLIYLFYSAKGFALGQISTCSVRTLFLKPLVVQVLVDAL